MKTIDIDAKSDKVFHISSNSIFISPRLSLGPTLQSQIQMSCILESSSQDNRSDLNLGLKQTHSVHSSSCSEEICRPQFLIVKHEYHLLASPK